MIGLVLQSDISFLAPHVQIHHLIIHMLKEMKILIVNIKNSENQHFYNFKLVVKSLFN